MTPVKTDYSNVTYTAEGCFDLPGTIAKRQDGQEEIFYKGLKMEWDKTERRVFDYEI